MNSYESDVGLRGEGVGRRRGQKGAWPKEPRTLSVEYPLSIYTNYNIHLAISYSPNFVKDTQQILLILNYESMSN
jgi:hypothetical protein